MLQPGRTRLVFVHVILDPDTVVTVEEMDILRDTLQSELTVLHPKTQMDMLFSKNPKWASPFGTVAEGKDAI